MTKFTPTVQYEKAHLLHWVEYAKWLTADYAKTHKGRNALEKECIKKGYLITSLNLLGEKGNRKILWALHKSPRSKNNWVPICSLGRKEK